LGCGKQVASRRALAWNRWVGWAPGLVNHTLLHPACLPSLSVSRRQLYSSRRKCIPAYTSRPREAERYVGGGTLSVSQTASRSSKQPRASESRAEASRQHRQEASTLNINMSFLFICRSIYISMLSTTPQAYYHHQHQHCTCTEHTHVIWLFTNPQRSSIIIFSHIVCTRSVLWKQYFTLHRVYLEYGRLSRKLYA
jgi:hypothetical protein